MSDRALLYRYTWAQGIRSSSKGSYSNCALTNISQGGGADR